MAMLVRHAMTEAPQTCRPDMTAEDAAGLMRQLDVGVLPVTDGDELVGLVTDRDLVVRVLAERKEPANVKLGEIATRSPVTVTPDTDLSATWPSRRHRNGRSAKRWSGSRSRPRRRRSRAGRNAARRSA